MSELNWEVERRAITIEGVGVDTEEVSLVRSDTNTKLANRKVTYCPPSIAEFKERAEEICSITGFSLNNYEEYNGGRTILGFLESSEKKMVAGHQMKRFMVIGNSYDSRTSFFIGTSDVYVRCTNAFSNILKSMKVRNTSNSKAKRDQLMREIEMFEKGSNGIYTMYNRFGDRVVDEQVKNDIALQVLGLDKKIEKELEFTSGDYKKLDTLMAGIRSECADLGDNLWGVFNGVTYYTTHELEAKDQGRIFGQPGLISKKAYEVCSDLVLV